MITNTELQYKGNLFPGEVSAVQKEGDTLAFKAENGTILRIQIVRIA